MFGELLIGWVFHLSCDLLPFQSQGWTNYLLMMIPAEKYHSDISKDLEMIRQSALESTGNFPEEVVEMIKECDIGSLILTRLRYHAPWDILFGRFTKGTVTVAGVAMHVMAPFLGQGGSAAIVLARCFAQHLASNKVQALLQTYVKQRRMRLVKLSTQTYLTGMLLEP